MAATHRQNYFYLSAGNAIENVNEIFTHFKGPEIIEDVDDVVTRLDGVARVLHVERTQQFHLSIDASLLRL